MAYIERTVFMQNMIERMEFYLRIHGWKSLFKRRLKSGDRYIELILFFNKGMDGQERHLGLAAAYDKNEGFYGEDNLIWKDNRLGFIGTGNGQEVEFKLNAYPVDTSEPFDIFLDDDHLSSDEYELYPEKGVVIFDSPPGDKVEITAQYYINEKAPDPVDYFTFFTFATAYLQEYDEGAGEYVDIEGDVLNSLGLGDGETTEYDISEYDIENYDDVRVYVGGPYDEVMTGWQIDEENDLLTFDEAPGEEEEVFIQFKTESGGILGRTFEERMEADEKEVGSFDHKDPEQVIEQVYGSMRIYYLSLPTVLSLTASRELKQKWHRDNDFHIIGNFNYDRVCCFLRLEAAPDPYDAMFTPFYCGKLFSNMLYKPPKNMILIGGCIPDMEVNWSEDKQLGGKNVDYGPQTSNGNNSVLLKKAIGGPMYMGHQFAFITHDREIDMDDGHYNPSRYSSKYHVSKFFVVHKNDGFVGHLDDVYAAHPTNIYQGDELEIDDNIEQEFLGYGDGDNKHFFVSHRPANLADFVVYEDCTERTDFTFNTEHRRVEFDSPPASGAELQASYSTKQKYVFYQPSIDLDRSPFTLTDRYTRPPFAPMGLAILKDYET